MFSAQNKPTIVNEGLVTDANSLPPLQQASQPPNVSTVQTPVSSPQPPINPSIERVKKVLRVFIPVSLLVGVMVVLSFLISAYKKPVIVVPSPTPIPTLVPATPAPTPDTDPFKDWKAYINRNNEISFKYPPQVRLEEETLNNDLSLTLTKEQDGSLEVAQIIISKSKTSQSLVSTYVLGGTVTNVTADEEIQISGVPGKLGQFTVASGGEGTPLTYAYVTHGKLNFLFIGKTISEKALFLKIIETVRFVTPGVTDEWLDFTSTAGSFSLKYPKEWTLSSQEPGVATASSKLLSLRKNATDIDYQNIIFQTSAVTGKESVTLSASELISSLQNLSGWKDTPTLDFRSFGVAQSQLISGIKDGAWTEYGVFWVRNTLVQLSWKDTLLRQEQDTFEDILSTLKFK